jgi:hypothetical protein
MVPLVKKVVSTPWGLTTNIRLGRLAHRDGGWSDFTKNDINSRFNEQKISAPAAGKSMA